MTPQQALEIVAQASSLAPLNLQQHQTCQQALSVLVKTLNSSEEKKKE